jgi:prepilin-type processing-associated H-X9-DG protein
VTNSTVFLASVATFLCPSDNNQVFKYGTNYECSVGPQFNFNWAGRTSTGGPGGVFVDRMSFGIADITDGTSNTVAFGEALIGDNSTATLNGAEYYNCVPWPSGTNGGQGSATDSVIPNPAAITNYTNYIQACNAARSSVTSQQNDRNSYWCSGRMAQGPLSSMLLPPNSPNADCDINSGTGMFAFRSRHAGGVNGLLGDGSVRFFKSSVAQNIWWALATKAGGETVSADSY